MQTFHFTVPVKRLEITKENVPEKELCYAVIPSRKRAECYAGDEGKVVPFSFWQHPSQHKKAR